MLATHADAALFASDELGRPASCGIVDIHCHCLPAVDDGPATIDEALDLCRALVRDGVGTVVATPHQLGRYDGRNAGPAVLLAVAALSAALGEAGIPLAVLPGAEVRMDERIPDLLRSGEILTIAGRGTLLLELPPDGYTDPLPLIRWLAREGVRTAVAHVERHRPLWKRPDVVLPWVDAGAALQVNAASLVGDAGADVAQAAWGLLTRALPLPLLVASDAHNLASRPPRWARARELIERRLGLELARKVCDENPRKAAGPALSRP